MQDLVALKAEATEAASFRGHRLIWCAPWHGERASIQRGICERCGMEVDVCNNPMPNGIDIGGEAVALNCPGEGI